MLNQVLGIVGWLGTALVFAAVAIRFLRPAWDQYAYWTAISGLVCVLLYTLSQWREIGRAFQRRQARFGTMAAVSVVAVLGILVIANYLAGRQNKRWDLTASKTFSLSDQSLKIVRGLDAPVKMLVFAQEPDFARFRDRLNEYEYASKNVSVEYIDADKQPVRARQYQVQAYGTVVFEYKGRTERVTSDTEQDVTNGLIKVLTGKQVKLYFVQGHGEKDPTNAEQNSNGYSAIAAALGRDNFSTDKLVLAQQGDVPSDATVVVIAGPTTDSLPGEIDALRRYLRKAGKVLFMIDPSQDGKPLTNLEALLKEWDVELGHNIVVDVSGMGQLLGTDASVPVAANYPAHAITDRFNLLTAYPLAQSVTGVTGNAEKATPQTFIETSQRSWAETDLKSLTGGGQVSLDEAKGDRRGPISIGVAATAPAPEAPVPASAGSAGSTPKPESRVVVVGDSDFVANNVLGIRGNSDLFLNMVNWLAQQENMIAIRPREPDDRRITLTADQQRRIVWLSLLLVPGLILGSGVYTWWQRR